MTSTIRSAARLPRPPRRIGIDVRACLGVIGGVVQWFGLAFALPVLVALGYREPPWPFLVPLLGSQIVAVMLRRFGRSRRVVGIREGYLVVSGAWLAAAALGAIPYLLSGDPQVARPVDAWFESMSGVSTTGATVVQSIDTLDRSLLLWRQMSQWLGGLGVIVLALAVLPRLRIEGRQQMEADYRGADINDLVTRIRRRVGRFGATYLILTACLAAVLSVLGWTGLDRRLGLLDAAGLALSTMSTGGFATQPGSAAGLAPVTQWVLVVFMVLAGANIALLVRALIRRDPAATWRDEELRFYLLLLGVGAALLTAVIIAQDAASGAAGIRVGIFHAVSIITTTGFVTADIHTWTALALAVLAAMMFIGGSAGSTGGSVKVVRHLLIARLVRREVRYTVQPELAEPIRLNRSVVDERTLRSVSAFGLLYIGTFVIGAGVLALDAAVQGTALSAIDVMTAAAGALGNVGPGTVAGGSGSVAGYSDISTLTLTLLMWLGRLELLPVLAALTRSYWRP